MAHRVRAVAALCLVLAWPVFAGEAELGARLDAYVADAMKTWETPGLAIAVVKDGKTILARGYGVRTLGSDDAVDADTLFAIGSTTKAFTALALGVLVDEETIDWDDRVVDRLSGFQLYDPYATREMRIRDLLCHRSGLSRGDMLWYGTDRSREDILRQIRYLEPSWSFRSTWGYQNIMYLAAGEIIPEVTGTSWDDFVRTRIFQPLGMTRTYTSTSVLAEDDNVATPHGEIDDAVQTLPHRNIDNVAPAGAIYSSASQMAEWLKLHLARGEYGGERIVSEAVVKEMQTPQMAMRYEGRFAMYSPDSHFLSYGLGWFLADYKGRRSAHHGGAIDGMRAHVGALPEENIGVVALCNMDGSLLPVGVTYWIYDRLLDEAETDWSSSIRAEFEKSIAEQEESKRKRGEARVANTAPSLLLEKYAGTFVHPVYEAITIRDDDGVLRVIARGYEGALSHWHYDTFECDWDEATRGESMLTFRLNADGEADTLVIEDLGEFRRVSNEEN